MIKDFKEKYKRFRTWQKQPYQVAPLSDESHDCATCGTHYSGNYCPRCGQSARIGRYSFKQAFLLFLDVWGLGNRGMFRTIRDLILRPGYMIRDYLQGMQMAYFPPFKMFFLLVALSLLVSSGFNIKLENRLEKAQKEFSVGMNSAFGEKDSTYTANTQSFSKTEDSLSIESKAQKEKSGELSKKTVSAADDFSMKVYEWCMKHVSIVTIVFLLFFSGPLYLFFHKSPAYPNIRFSEFFVAMVYSTNMLDIYSTTIDFFCVDYNLAILILLLMLIPIKQLSGYSYWRTLLRFILALVVFIIAIIAIILVVGVIYGLFH